MWTRWSGKGLLFKSSPPTSASSVVELSPDIRPPQGAEVRRGLVPGRMSLAVNPEVTIARENTGIPGEPRLSTIRQKKMEERGYPAHAPRGGPEIVFLFG